MPKQKTFPITNALRFLKTKDVFVLLESSLYNKENHLSYVFTDPERIITCYRTKQIKPCLEQLEELKKQGFFLSGFLSYEAGYAFCKKFRHNQNKKYKFPLIWMGVFKNPYIYDHNAGEFINTSKIDILSDNYKLQDTCKISNLKFAISRADYISNIQKIKKLIKTGDTYQVNYTTKLKFNLKGSDFALYQKLRNKQPVGYNAFIKSRRFSILSYSPELFFRQTKEQIYVRPMKGTMPRGTTTQDDIKIRRFLRNDPKNRAENIMIVDLLRNDLGKISKTSSVKTTRLFHVEKYKTLFQMTSTIQSRLKKGIGLYNLFSSLHPSGSITGAPKIRTMEIIKDLEQEDRKIYTGSIGYISPDETSVFNVAIRTILLKDTKGEMGIGGGITYSSNAQSEWNECKLKAKFLTQPSFQLIETMRWSKKEGIFLLQLHLKRLRASAKFFGFVLDTVKIHQLIKQKIKTLNPRKKYKLRLLLNISGNSSIHASVLNQQEPRTDTPKICISPHRLNPKNIYLYHKTTNRSLYEKEFRKHKKEGFHDVVFLNTKNQLCEGAISNIFIKKGSFYYTPPVTCGILPGVFRKYFINQNKDKVKEKILYIEDLKNADELYCVNSVRGIVKVCLEHSQRGKKQKKGPNTPKTH